MLVSLHIENIAVAKDINIEFSSGLSVITGETGAGKSVIIDCLNLLSGSKVSKDMIRQGCDKASVFGLFSDIPASVTTLCEEYGIEYDREDLFSISRSINADGKSISKINNHPITLMQLRQIGQMLINIHGQNENYTFMDKSSHILMLDEYANIEEELKSYFELYSKLCDIKTKITSLGEMAKQKEMMADILKFQISEINSAKLKDENEEEKLLELRGKLKSTEKISKNASNVYKAICQNDSGITASFLVDKAVESLQRINDIDPEIQEYILKLSSFKYEMIDIAEKIKDFAIIEGAENPDKKLDEIEERLSVIQKLKRKYGSNVSEIIAFGNNAQEKLSDIEESEEKIADLTKEYKKIYALALENAEKLHNIRIQAAKILENSIMDTLKFLDMPKVRFEISVKMSENNGKTVLDKHGFDDVEFMIATNVGEELLPMSKIASGGELSRIMLALKSTVSDNNGAGTVIFDEIDTGVSGSTSQKIGAKLYDISKNTQTICVTHSPQIASMATNHFFINKKENDGRAETHVKLLNRDERISEIARIIGGIDLTEKQYDAARELIEQSERMMKNEKV